MKPHKLAAAVLLLAACKNPSPAAGGAGGKGGEAGGASGASAGGPQSAAGGATPGATRITECPQSLGGQESKIDRVISKDCGAVTVTDQYNIDGGSLTLEAGATLQFKDGAALVVGYYEPAKLIVQGTPEAPVTLTSAGDKVAGAWRGVELHEKAARSSLAGAVIEFAGDDDRALFVAAPDVSITGTTVRDTKGTAIKIDGAGRLAAFTGNTFAKLGGKAALVVLADAVGGIGAGNKFDGGSHIAIPGGGVTKSATWQNPGVPYYFPQQVSVDAANETAERAVVTLSPGTELKFGPDGRLTVGYYWNAGLVAKGTADAPITFTAAETREPGAWTGVQVFSKGQAEIEHAAFEFGGKDDEAALLVDGQIALRQTTFRSNRIGVIVRGDAAKITAFADNKFAATPTAVKLPPRLVAGLGEGNAFDADARILVEGGSVTGTSTWLAQGAPLVLEGEVHASGELTLEAGLKALGKPDGQLTIGYYEGGKLLAKGTAAAPITFGATDAAWGGIKLSGNATGSVLEYVQLSQTGENPGVWVDGGVEAKLDNVSCARCKGAVVGWACGAKVSRSSVLASEGTPTIEKAPDGC